MDVKTPICTQPSTENEDGLRTQSAVNSFTDRPHRPDEPDWFVVKSVSDPVAATRDLKVNLDISGWKYVKTLVYCRPSCVPFGVSMKPYAGTTLSAVLATTTFSESDIWRISFDILRAISFAHGESSVLRDICPETILLSRNGKISLGDFGTSAARVEGCPMSSPAGTPWYMAPELYRVPLKYNGAVDMWAFGVVLFDMVSGRERPSEGDGCEGDPRKWRLYIRRQLNVNRFPVSAELAKVIVALLGLLPRERPTPAQLLRHPFYRRERESRTAEQGRPSSASDDEEEDCTVL
jgi:serine/threonine protein kinase